MVQRVQQGPGIGPAEVERILPRQVLIIAEAPIGQPVDPEHKGQQGHGCQCGPLEALVARKAAAAKGHHTAWRGSAMGVGVTLSLPQEQVGNSQHGEAPKEASQQIPDHPGLKHTKGATLERRDVAPAPPHGPDRVPAGTEEAAVQQQADRPELSPHSQIGAVGVPA